MKKNILKASICIGEIEKIIAENKTWEIIDKKYDFYQSYVSTFDKLNYEAKIDLYISFKTKNNFIHNIYCYFLNFDNDNDNVFKISDIKSKEYPRGQTTTRVADFKYYKTTGNLGFSTYHSPVKGQEYNLSHNYHSFFNALVVKEEKELNYVCILLKYHNHAQNKKLVRYYVNSYKKFISSFLLKIEKFEKKKIRLEKKTAKLMIKTNKKKIKVANNLQLKLNNDKNLKYNLSDNKLPLTVIEKVNKCNEE